MRVFVRRPSYSLCVTRRDWVPLQMLCHRDVWPVLSFKDGPVCLINFL